MPGASGRRQAHRSRSGCFGADPGGEMKMPAHIVAASGSQPIGDRQRTILLHQPERPLMSHRVLETLMPVMTSRVFDTLRRFREAQVLGIRRLEEPENPLGLEVVLLLAVDLDGV